MCIMCLTPNTCSQVNKWSESLRCWHTSCLLSSLTHCWAVNCLDSFSSLLSSSFLRILHYDGIIIWPWVLLFYNFIETATLDMPCGKIPVLLISWFAEILPATVMSVLTSHLWHYNCNSPPPPPFSAPNMFRVQSSTFIIVSCRNFGRTCELGMRLVLHTFWSLVYEQLIVYVDILGLRLLQLWCQWWHHSVGRIFQTCRNLQNSLVYL